MGCCGSSNKKKLKNRTASNSSEANQKPADGVTHELADVMIENLLHKTKFSHQEIVEWWQGFLTDCPSGLLDKNKFIEVYQTKYPTGKAKPFCDHVFRTFDPDKKTRTIDFERFMCAINITLNGTPDEKLAWAFTMYDINGDGLISKKEMSSVLEAMFDLLGKDKQGSNKPRNKVNEIFKMVDSDEDGYINKNEFFAGCKSDENIRAILAPYY